MMMPVMPSNPTTVNIDSGTSHCAWPQIVPTRPKGMIAITTMGRVQLAKTSDSTM